MDNQPTQKEIKELEKQGWKLCVGCIHCFDDECKGCGIEKRKRMGLPPNSGGERSEV